MLELEKAVLDFGFILVIIWIIGIVVISVNSLSKYLKSKKEHYDTES